MPHKPVKVTRPRSFHLTKSTLHQPITNLSGDGEAVDRISFDKAKLARLKAKLAADVNMRDPAAAQAEAELNAERAREQEHEHGLHQTTQVPNTGNLAQQAGSEVVNMVVPQVGGFSRIAGPWWQRGLQLAGLGTGAVARAAGEGVTGGITGNLASRPDSDAAITGDMLEPDGSGVGRQIQRRLDPIRSAELQGNAGSSLVSAAQNTLAPRMMPAMNAGINLYGGLNDLRTRTPGPGETDQDRVTKAQLDAGATGAQYAGVRTLADTYYQNAAKMRPAGLQPRSPFHPLSMVQRLKDNWNAVTAPMQPEVNAATDIYGDTRPVAAAAPQALSAAGRVLPAIGRLANNPVLRAVGRGAGRAGMFGMVANAGSALGNGIYDTVSPEGQRDFADSVQAQTEADNNRSTWGETKDTTKAVGSAALGDTKHLAAITARDMADYAPGQPYSTTVDTDDKSRDVFQAEQQEHQQALQKYFPNADPDQIAHMGRVAAQQSANNYRLYRMNNKMFPVGQSSFEKRLYDPQGPYADLSTHQRAIYQDLGRRMGGTVAEGLVNDPQFAQELDPNAKLQEHVSPYVSYAGYAPKPAAPAQAPAPVAPPPAPPMQPHGAAQRVPVAGPPNAPHGAAQRPPPIKVPPPPKPNPGSPPIGQPFSPLRDAKTAADALAVPKPAPAMPSAPAAIPPSKPAIPAGTPPVPPAAPAPVGTPAAASALPKNVSHPFGDFEYKPGAGPGQLQQPGLSQPAAAPVPPATPPRPPEGQTIGQQPPAAPAAQSAPASPPGAAQPYDWNQVGQTFMNDAIGSFMPGAKPMDAKAFANVAPMFQEGLQADARLPDAQKAQQLAKRESLFGSPLARNAMAAYYGDPSMADPKVPYAQVEQKVAERVAAPQAAAIQAQLDKTPSQTPADLLKNNWQLAMIPIGIMMAMSSSGSAGKIMGLLMAIGGGANVYGRYAAMKTPEFSKYVQAKAAGTTTPEMDQKYAGTWQDFAMAASKGMVNVPDLVKQKADETVRSAQPLSAQQPAAPTQPPAAVAK